MVANFDAFTTKLFLMLYNLKNGRDVLSLETSLPASYLSIKLAPSQNLTPPFCGLGPQCMLRDSANYTASKKRPIFSNVIGTFDEVSDMFDIMQVKRCHI